MTHTTQPEHTFLTRREVFARYRWGRTKGYQELGRPTFPSPIAGAWRLDMLMQWEATQVAGAAAAETTTPTSQAPPAAGNAGTTGSAAAGSPTPDPGDDALRRRRTRGLRSKGA